MYFSQHNKVALSSVALLQLFYFITFSYKIYYLFQIVFIRMIACNINVIKSFTKLIAILYYVFCPAMQRLEKHCMFLPLNCFSPSIVLF